MKFLTTHLPKTKQIELQKIVSLIQESCDDVDTDVVAWLFIKSRFNHPPLEGGSKSEAIRGGVNWCNI